VQENLPVSRASDHLYILATVLFTVYSQLAMRWQVGAAGEVPSDAVGKVRFIATLLINPWVVSGIVATFLAGVSWMLTMTRFEIGYAYPFVSLNYVIVLAASVLLFHESLSVSKILGTAFVITGIVVISRG
jgi:multidrug transporter EmrE-like cation transporter